MVSEPTLLPIHVYGDDTLRKKAKAVEVFDEDLKRLVRDMVHTMYIRDGVGLAAPQVGKDVSLFVVDTQWSKEGGTPLPRVMINPKIIESEGEIEHEEGCISIPGIYAYVHRPSKIRYSYYDLNGRYHEAIAEDFEAVVIQHENDHLHGVLFIDHISSLSKLKLKLKLKEIAKTAVDGVNIRDDIYVSD